MSTDQILGTEVRPELATKTDHNGTRHESIDSAADVVQSEMSDGARQSGRALQAVRACFASRGQFHDRARYVPDGPVGHGDSRSLAEHPRWVLNCEGTGQVRLSHSFPS